MIKRNKTVFGFLVEVLAGEKGTVEISYHLGTKLRPGQETDYLFLVQKQSGADPSRLTLTINLPPQATVSETSPLPVRANGGVRFEEELQKDLLFQTRLEL